MPLRPSYNYAVKILTDSGASFTFALRNCVRSGAGYPPRMTGVPSITETTPPVGNSAGASDKFSCEVTNGAGEFTSWLLPRSNSSFVDIVGATLTCWEIEVSTGAEVQVFLGKVSSIDVAYASGDTRISISGDADGSKVLSEALPSTFAIPTNRLTNGDCATDVVGWVAIKDAGATVTLSYNPGGGADAGSGFLVATHSAGGYATVGAKYLQEGTFTSGRKMGASAFIKAVTGTLRSAYVEIYDGNGVMLVRSAAALLLGNVWTRVYVNTTLTADYTSLEVRVYLFSGTTSGEVVHIDHVRLTEPDAFPTDDLLAYEEGQGRPIPFLFGGHRAHHACVPAVKDPSNNFFGHVVCRDMTDYLCRAEVNTLYGYDGSLRVLDSAVWDVDRTTYPGRVLAVLTNNRYPAVYADCEASEFDTTRTNVVRHWRFRNGSLIDDKNSKELSLAVLADWGFNGNLNDSSGNGYTLSVQNSGVINYYPASSSRGIDQNTVGWGMPSGKSPVKLGLATPNSASFDFDETESFTVEVTVKGDSYYNALGDYAVSKFGWGKGWGVGFDNSVPYFMVSLQETTEIKSYLLYGDKPVNDGKSHVVIGAVDRSTKTISLYVDGVLISTQAYDSAAGMGSTSDTNVNLTVLGTDLLGACSTMFLDRVRIFSKAYGSASWEVTTDSGHSEVSTSAIAMASNSSNLVESSPTGIDPGALQEMNLLVWFKAVAVPTGDVKLLCRRNTTSDGYTITLKTTGAVSITIGDGVDVVTLTSGTGLCDGEWHCVFVTLVRTSALLTLYVDGVQVAQGSTSAVGGLANSATSLFIQGYVATVSGVNQVILIDEIMIAVGGTGTALTAAQVRTHYMTATGNPARIVRTLIEDGVIGLAQTVDSTTFDAAENTFSTYKIRYDGALIEQVAAGDVFDMLCSPWGAYVKQLGSSWKMGFAWQGVAATPYDMGYGAPYSNVASVKSFGRTSSKEIPKTLNCRYRPVTDPTDPTGTRLALTTSERSVSSAGVNKASIDLPFVRRPKVADRIAYFLSEWAKADRFLTLLLTNSLRAIRAGDAANLTITDLGFSASAVRVGDVSRDDAGISVAVRDDAVNALSYVAGAISPDIVSEIDADYSTTVPPPPSDLLLIENVGVSRGTNVRVGWTLPTGASAEEVVDAIRVYWIVPEDRTADNIAKGGKFKYGIDGWVAVKDVGATVTVSHESGRGVQRVRGFLKAKHSAGGFATIGASRTRALYVFPVGDRYIGTAYIQSATGAGRTGTIRIKDQSGTVISGTTVNVAMTNANEWYKLSTSFVSSGLSGCTVEVYVSAGAVSGETVYIDEVELVLDPADSSNFEGSSKDLPPTATSCVLKSAGDGVEPGKALWIWVKTRSKWGIESVAAGIHGGEVTATYGPNTVLEVIAARDVGEVDTDTGEAAIVDAGNFGHEDRLVAIETRHFNYQIDTGDGVPTANKVLYSAPIAFRQTFRTGLPGSAFWCRVGPTSGSFTVTMRYRRGGVNTTMGTIVYPVGATPAAPTVTFSADVTLEIGDVLELVAQAGVDATFQRLIAVLRYDPTSE